MYLWLWLILSGVALGRILRRFAALLNMPSRSTSRRHPPRPAPQRTPSSRPARQPQSPPAPAAPAAWQNDFVVYFANDPHNQADREYRFQYARSGNSWRAYILKMPSLGGRDPSGVVTHRLYTADGRPYVCWNRDVGSLRDMQAISKLWADSIQEYIATGKRFG